MSSFTVRLEDGLTAQLENLAESMDRSKSYLTAQALREFLAREAWFVADVEEGRRQAERGEFVPEAEMEAMWERLCGAKHPQHGK